MQFAVNNVNDDSGDNSVFGRRADGEINRGTVVVRRRRGTGEALFAVSKTGTVRPCRRFWT